MLGGAEDHQRGRGPRVVGGGGLRWRLGNGAEGRGLLVLVADGVDNDVGCCGFAAGVEWVKDGGGIESDGWWILSFEQVREKGCSRRSLVSGLQNKA